ncbi:SGNH/GDSL hydrolase family protein [Sphingobium scionense]|nr:SGNH/GDSL hydrolase family protein [Sphingobium scionense]
MVRLGRIERGKMPDTLKLCVIGGSNSLMRNGYTPPLVANLERRTGKKVDFRNLSVGGTFCHFGLWQVVTKGQHIDADVIIVEYALNDAELARFGIHQQWTKAYEGMIARLRRDNPTAQILTPLLFSRSNTGRTQISGISSGVALINMRYGVSTIDVTQELLAKAPLNYWDPAKEWHRDQSHYHKFLQVMIGEMVADRILKGEGYGLARDYAPIMPGHFINAQSAVMANKFDMMLPADTKFRDFSNSLFSERAAIIGEGAEISFNVQGSVVAVMVVSTREDGVVCAQFGAHKSYFSLRRRALDDEKYPFLLNLVIPDQYFGKQICASLDVEERFSLRLVADAEAEQVGYDNIQHRGTARLPDQGSHELAVIDLLFDGVISPVTDNVAMPDGIQMEAVEA